MFTYSAIAAAIGIHFGLAGLRLLRIAGGGGNVPRRSASGAN
jgi:hypothetical protein